MGRGAERRGENRREEGALVVDERSFETGSWGGERMNRITLVS